MVKHSIGIGSGFLHTASFQPLQMLIATTSSIRQLSGCPAGGALSHGSVSLVLASCLLPPVFFVCMTSASVNVAVLMDAVNMS